MGVVTSIMRIRKRIREDELLQIKKIIDNEVERRCLADKGEKMRIRSGEDY